MRSALLAVTALCLAAAAPASAAVDRTKLPLGDGKYRSSPGRGSVFSCQRFNPNGPGAQADGPWIDAESGTWDSTRKIAVRGSVGWDSVFTRSVTGDVRALRGNGLPSSPTGEFPIASDDPAYQYDRNPNAIRANALSRDLPATPRVAGSPTCAGGTIGVSLLGVPIYSAFDATGRDAAAHEVQDGCGGHPQMSGQYHFHSLPPCLAGANGRRRHSKRVGYALDGFGIYGYRGRHGAKLTNADLDACHGHSHRIRWNGRRRRLFHYHATREFPYLLGCYRGTPIG